MVYEIHNEEGKTTHATGSHLTRYMSSDAFCMVDEDQSSSQGDCLSKIVVCKCHTFLGYLSSAADVCSPKDVIIDTIHVGIHGCMQLVAIITAPQHLVCRVVQSLHTNHMQMGIVEVFVCRRVHMALQ